MADTLFLVTFNDERGTVDPSSTTQPLNQGPLQVVARLPACI
jgi:hypothetical protein